MHKTTPREHGRGFTLIEVLVALLILALAFMAIADTMTGMLRNATLMRERTYASWIAQNRIVQLRAEGTVPKTGRNSGKVEFAGQDWEWRSEISETGIENLLRVDVRVSFDGDDAVIKTVTGFLGEPALPGIANNLWVGAVSGGGGSNGDGTDGDSTNGGDDADPTDGDTQ